MTEILNDTGQNDNRRLSGAWKAARRLLSRISPYFSGIFSVPRISTEPRLLARLLRSENSRARILSIRALAAIKCLPDWYCIDIVQSCYDSKVMASLALLGSNIPEYAKRIAPGFGDENNVSIEMELRSLLKSLHPFTQDSCVALNTELALKNALRPPMTEHDEILWTAHDEEDERPVSFGYSSKVRKLVAYMESLGLLSTLPDQRERMVEAKTFDVLRRIWELNTMIAPTDFRLPILILKVISNMALSQKSGLHFLASGWFVTLAKCRSAEKIELSLLAEKCLANLAHEPCGIDGELKRILYDDGVYVLHDSRERRCAADIIFVHGLRGGVFYSWRQKDVVRKALLDKRVEDTKGLAYDGYTYCWPKDWFPLDLKRSDVRVLGIDYASFVTDWGQTCPEYHERNTIIAKGRDMMEKLSRAGVGARPIIWVCHSMGGLLVKELLCAEKTSKEHSKFAENTIGVAFYSVPHRGSPIATRSVESRYRYLLLPSVEVSELRQSSKYLQLLQKAFVDSANSKFQVMNISETVPTTFPMGIKALVVPEASSNAVFGTHYRLGESHLHVCKPVDRHSVNYRILVDFVNGLL